MANLGISNASYYTDRFIHKINKEVDNSVNKLSTARENITASDVASLKSMDYTFRLDIAATNAAVKNMSMTQAYLSTAITSLDNASAILARIHELAVLGANSSNSVDDLSALDVEAEALADEFHKSMSSADFKGKLVFDVEDDTQTGRMSLGKISAGTAEFGIGALDYDILYDYKNPSTDRYNTGLTYEITEELTDAQKAALLSRLPDATEEDLVVGYQFVAQAQEKVGEGLEVSDLTYNRSEGVKQFDALASFTGDGEFDGYHLEFQVSENSDASDNLSIESNGNIRVLEVGNASNPLDVELIQYFDDTHNKWIDIAKIDEEKNGEDGKVLRVNLLSDATIPETSNIPNGDFELTSNFVTEVIMDPVMGPETDANGDVVLYPRMENVVENVLDANGDPVTENVTEMVEQNVLDANGDPVMENVTEMVEQNVLDANGDPVMENVTEMVEQNVLDANGDPVMENVTEMVEQNVLDANGDPVMENVTEMVEQNVLDANGDPVMENVTEMVEQNVLDANGDPVMENVTEMVEQNVLDANGDPVMENVTEMVEQNVLDANGDPVTTPVTQTVQRQVEIDGVLQFDENIIQIGETPRDITELRPDNWHYAEENIDFGSNFTIYEDYIIDRVNGGPVAGDPASAVSIPTPSEADMIKPDYEDYEFTVTLPDGTDFTDTRSPTAPENAGVMNNDDNPINTLLEGGTDLSISIDSTGGENDLDLATGFVKMQKGFGIFHGPAAVSDVFSADAGDFLKFDYDARIVDDDFHVAGYIYNVDTNEITMALNATDSYGAGTASVEVSETANYRFVFVVGTYDLTGGREAGSNMKIDNVRAEDAYDIKQDAIDELLKALHYSNQSATAAPSKVLSTNLLEAGTENITITDLSDINITGVSGQPAGPFMEVAGARLMTTPSDAITESNSSILTSKIEAVQEEINSARSKAASQLLAISSAIESSTDLRSQFSLGSGTLTDLNFSSESAYLARRQIQHDIATAMLAQANLGQTHLISLLTQ